MRKRVTMRSVDETAPVKRTRLSAEERRESILRAAAEVFAATGYRAGKMSDVAARVGVSEPVVFQNFGSKAALFAAVLDRAADEFRRHLHALIERHGSASRALAQMFSPAEVGRIHTRGGQGALFADAAALLAEPRLTEHARRAIGAVAEHLAEMIRRGQVEGDIRADVDPAAASWLLLSVLSAQNFRSAAMPDKRRLEDAVIGLVLQSFTPGLGETHR
jgi:AcrR family transcriptional regulator